MDIIKDTKQILHCFIKSTMSGVDGFFCTFVYVFKEKARREELWNDLRQLLYTGPLICSFFNSVMTTYERIGSLVREIESALMRECMVDLWCC